MKLILDLHQLLYRRYPIFTLSVFYHFTHSRPVPIPIFTLSVLPFYPLTPGTHSYFHTLYFTILSIHTGYPFQCSHSLFYHFIHSHRVPIPIFTLSVLPFYPITPGTRSNFHTLYFTILSITTGYPFQWSARLTSTSAMTDFVSISP